MSAGDRRRRCWYGSGKNQCRRAATWRRVDIECSPRAEYCDEHAGEIRRLEAGRLAGNGPRFEPIDWPAAGGTPARGRRRR
jgi:hypothetical protein